MVDPTGFRPIVSGDLRGGTAVVKTSTGSYVVSRKEEARFIESNGSTTAKKRQIQYEENYLRTLQKKAETNIKSQRNNAIEYINSVKDLSVPEVIAENGLKLIDQYRDTSEDWRGTVAIGPTGSLVAGLGFLGISGSAQVALAQDLHGNLALLSTSGGGFTSAGAGAGIRQTISFTNAPSVMDLSGLSTEVGTSLGGGLGGNIDYVEGLDQYGNRTYRGVNIGIGPQDGIEVHEDVVTSVIVAQWNPLDWAENYFKWVLNK